jgi:hypothetical protein
MKKIIFILILLIIINWIFLYKNIQLDTQLQKLSIKNKNLINTLNTLENEKKDILSKTYCNCEKWFNFWDICINKINKIFIKNNLESNQWNWTYNLLLDFWLEKDLEKLKKVLIILNNDFKWLKFKELRLSCTFNFDKNTLDLLKTLNIERLFIDTEECWFYNWNNTYNKELLKNFFKAADNIKEIEIWYISTDLFKKENWEIKFYSWD